MYYTDVKNIHALYMPSIHVLLTKSMTSDVYVSTLCMWQWSYLVVLLQSSALH